MGLEQYAGMSLEEKVTVILVKQDNIENLIAAKPCPSPDCIRCRGDVAELKVWKTKRETELAAEAEQKDDKQAREAWVIPLWASVIFSAAAIVFSIIKGG